ncbi:MAG: 4-oxalocrotonate tautomerase, partial [Desulfobacteraceae bacterium]|nr:4-oxalocrotonate tautomerase [Desulfobacteraceae bacterium]
MPHIIVKLYPGRSDQQKQRLADEITKNVATIAECKKSVVSVAFEEVDPSDWAQKVYKPDIIECRGTLYKEPGYNPFSSEKEQEEETPNLMEYIRGAAKTAQQEDTSEFFNPMSWLDL